MGIFISGSELAQIAIGIEKNGIAFYEYMAQSTGNQTASDAYKNLAGEEKEHMEVFQNMLKQMDDYQPPENYTEEYDLYLKALVDSAVFSDDKVACEMAKKAGSDAEAIQMAIGAEKDSILFYYNLRDLVRRTDLEAVDRILEQEKAHLRHLIGMKKKLAA